MGSLFTAPRKKWKCAAAIVTDCPKARISRLNARGAGWLCSGHVDTSDALDEIHLRRGRLKGYRIVGRAAADAEGLDIASR